jgi:peptide/nickel transport system permease protein
MLLRYLVFRVGRALVTLALMSMMVFGLTRLMGDPVSLLVAIDASEELREQTRERLGLDGSLTEQFTDFVLSALQGDFGNSIYRSMSSRDLLLDALPATLLLAAVAAAIAILVGVSIGVVASLKPRSWLDTVVSSISMAGVSMPEFWIALLLIFWLAVGLGLVPTSGSGTWLHLVMPAIVLAIRPIGSIAQVTRSSMIDQMRADYVVTAYAKGLKTPTIVRRHVLKNAGIPVVTMGGVEIADLMTGAIVVETIFNWPGVGRLASHAMQTIDYPVIQTVVFWAALITIVMNLLVDLSYAWLDPRTRQETR